jgi:ornithine carbamoyltransferase|eukprot:Stramenopile-MAST_4_protein_2400
MTQRMCTAISKGRHLLSLEHFTKGEIYELLRVSRSIKLAFKQGPVEAQPRYLQGESLAMIFQKRSTRTRVSSETGMFKLGGHSLFLGKEDIQLGHGETLMDTAKVLSRFNSAILARVYGHQTIEDLAEHASVPVINALSDKHHPLQILADLQTLQETFGENLTGLKVAWVGDGNNILNSLMVTLPKLGVDLSVATPKGYEPTSDILDIARINAAAHQTSLVTTTDPLEAVEGCHVVVTDTWISMGQEEEANARLKDFEGYQVTQKMMERAHTDWKFLHCLPRKPYEVHDEVFYSDRSLVFDEAENRMWTVMAVLMMQLRGTAAVVTA